MTQTTRTMTLAIRLAAATFLVAIAQPQVFGCSCSGGFFGKNAWDIARQRAQYNPRAAIFEGIPVRFTLQWDVLSAKRGDLLQIYRSAESAPPKYPLMIVTFRVLRAYAGNLGPEVLVSTGLGGGDCGARFQPGLAYLVYAGGTAATGWGVSMCSPGGWSGSRNVAADIRYLRHERPTATDLAPLRRGVIEPWGETPEERKRQEQRYRDLTGQICGTVIRDGAKDVDGAITALSTLGYSPAEEAVADTKPDGSFCTERLGPGKYYLYFTTGAWFQGPESAIYYPGATEREKATPVEIRAGQTRSDIIFRVPKQKTYAVSGVISTDGTWRDEGPITVLLIPRSDALRRSTYSQEIRIRPSWFFSSSQEFKFDHVVPGQYVVCADGLSKEWFFKKTEVSVTAGTKRVVLELVRKK